MATKYSKLHIHEFVKYKGKDGMWKCNDPRCYYTAPDALVKGKNSLCTQCKLNVLIMDSYQRQLSFPRCESCSGRLQDRLKVLKREKVRSVSLEDLLDAQS